MTEQQPTKVSELELKCLKALHSRYYDGEPYCVYFRVIAEETELTEHQVRRSVRALARKGLAVYERGLFDEDGMVAGSGYFCTDAGNEFMAETKDWKEEARAYFDLRYELLGVLKQPTGNREHWIDADIAFITRVVEEQKEKLEKIKDMLSLDLDERLTLEKTMEIREFCIEAIKAIES